MSMHKLTAGTGYNYLTRQVAALDATDKGHVALASYYTERGETPGAWMGSGLAGIHGLDAGDVVTAEQMHSLFGHGHHPLAAQRIRDLDTQAPAAAQASTDQSSETQPPTEADYRAATRLGAPFKVYANDFSDFRVEVARRVEAANAAAGLPRDWPVPAEQRAHIRTEAAVEFFRADHGRDPTPADSPDSPGSRGSPGSADRARELAATIARHSRPKTTAVAGYDLTFSPVKSVSTLWALADPATAATIERAHQQAVADALRFIETHALYTRLGANGVRQVDVTGLVATAFTHRDSRAGDPDLHTHVAVANKVQVRTADGATGAGAGRWLAIDGRILFKANVAASETYNTALEKHLTAALGLQFAARESTATGQSVPSRADRAGRPARDAKRPVREIVGVDPALNARWSARRAVIEVRRSQLAAEFQATHGRPPTPVETLQLAQQATLETRPGKHEPRTLAEQRATWRTQAEEVLGGSTAVDRMLAQASRPEQARSADGTRTAAPAHVDAWVAETAGSIVATLQERRSTWQTWHVRAEAQRRVRACGVPAEDVEPLVARLINAALDEHSVPLTGQPVSNSSLGQASHRAAAGPSDQPAEQIEPPEPAEPTEPTEPTVLRRADGSSMYTVAGADLYTSTAILNAEQRLVAAAGQAGGFAVTDAEVDLALLEATANGTRLNPGQATLVRAMATSCRRLQLAIAPAGSGKTTAMRALAAAWTEAGGTVLGLAPSAAAAAALGDQIQVHTDTLAKLTWSIPLVRRPGPRAEHEQGASHGSARTESDQKAEMATLDDVPAWVADIGPRTLVVIDEAGMADTLSLDTAVAFITSRGGGVRLIGDDQQLAAIGAGGVLRDIATTHGAQRLTELLRFTDPAEANASLALREGQPEALGYYLDHHRVHVGDLATMTDDLFTAWQTDQAAGRDALMLAPTRDLVAILNRRARTHRLAHDGHVDRATSTATDGRRCPDDPAKEAETNHEDVVAATAQPLIAVRLSDGNGASIGDTVITRRNDRRLRLGATDWVKNGDRWTVLNVDPTTTDSATEPETRRRYTHAPVGPSTAPDASAGAVLTVRHCVTGRVVRLPADYVATWVELGYATTVHGAQGVTADTCHALLSGAAGAGGTGGASRQHVYTMLTRGRQANHVYLEVVGDGDPHTVIRPDMVHPATPTDLLETVLARDEAPTSATTTRRLDADPGTRLGHATQRYHEALHVAAEDTAGPALLTALDQHTDTLVSGLPDLADRPAWPALRAHLLLIAAATTDPDTNPVTDTLAALRAAAQSGNLATADDPAAVLDWRLDDTEHERADPAGNAKNARPAATTAWPHPSTGVPADAATASGPLPWLPGIPTALAEHPTWGPYLRARHNLVTHLADAVRTRQTDTPPGAAPVWERNGLITDPKTCAEVEVWRAAMQVDPDDRRPTGPRQLQKAAALYQRRLDHRVRGDQAPALLEWGHLLHSIDPAIGRDPFTAVLAQRLAAVSRAGLDARNLALRAHLDGPLPDDHAAAALWWRITQRISPALAASTATDDTRHDSTSHAGREDLAPYGDWTTRLRDFLGDHGTDQLASSTWWPALATVIDHALARGWRLDNLIAPLPSAREQLHTHGAPQADADPGLPAEANPRPTSRPAAEVDPALAMVWRLSVVLDPVPPMDDAQGDASLLADVGLRRPSLDVTDPGEREVPPPLDMWDGVPPPADDSSCVDTHALFDHAPNQLTGASAGEVVQGRPTEADLDAALLRAAILRDARPDRVELTDADVSRALARAREWDFSPVTRERLVEVNQLAEDFFAHCFADSWAQTYLTDRLGMDLTGHELAYPGYAPAGWNHLTQHLARAGVTGEELLTAGLATTTRSGHVIDRLRDRLTFPIVHRGEVLGFVGRRHPDLTETDQRNGRAGPKYLNTPDTPLFHKGAQLFGLTPTAQQLVHGGATPVLVEGPLDALAVTIATAGRYVGLTPLGTALTEDQALQVATLVEPRVGCPGVGTQPIVATDADIAGRQAARRDFWLLTDRGLDPRVAGLPDGSDPADLLKRSGPAALAGALATAATLGDHLITELLAHPEGAHTRQELFAVTAARPGHTWNAAVSRLSAKWGTPRCAVLAQLLDFLDSDGRQHFPTGVRSQPTWEDRLEPAVQRPSTTRPSPGPTHASNVQRDQKFRASGPADRSPERPFR